MCFYLPNCVFRLITFRFKQRFKSLIEQYELRELHFHAQLRAKELEVQYHMARLDKEKKQSETEINKSRALNQQVATFSKTETELRNQLNIYVEKFKQVCTISHCHTIYYYIVQYILKFLGGGHA
jgi:UDP-N-acetylglucosamine transferase subunit ALG13